MQLATIDQNYENYYEVTIYEDGRLIHPHSLMGRFTLWDTSEEAHAIITKFYPDATVTTWNKVEEQYKADGYYYPLLKYGKTELLCHKCNSMLILDKESRGISEDGAWGNMYHIWYTCSGCKRAYANERIVGNIDYNGWDYKDVDSDKFLECSHPEHIPYNNSYGFRETVLLKKEQENNAETR